MLSHVALWETLTTLYGPTEYVVCFEDDASLCREMDNVDHAAVRNFMANGGDLLMLGFHPNIHRFRSTTQERLVRGHGLDLHAYVIRVGFAQKLHDEYADRMQSALHRMCLPLGHIDTLLLVHEVHALHPMLYVQTNEKRYANILSNGGICDEETQNIQTALFSFANRLWLQVPHGVVGNS